MKTLTSSEARQGFSAVIDSVEEEEVAISRGNREVAVVVSSTRYRELKKLEDILYVKAAELAIKEGFARDTEPKEVMNKLSENKTNVHNVNT